MQKRHQTYLGNITSRLPSLQAFLGPLRQTTLRYLMNLLVCCWSMDQIVGVDVHE